MEFKGRSYTCKIRIGDDAHARSCKAGDYQVCLILPLRLRLLNRCEGSHDE